jgi:hypothetical protein
LAKAMGLNLTNKSMSLASLKLEFRQNQTDAIIKIIAG